MWGGKCQDNSSEAYIPTNWNLKTSAPSNFRSFLKQTSYCESAFLIVRCYFLDIWAFGGLKRSVTRLLRNPIFSCQHQKDQKAKTSAGLIHTKSQGEGHFQHWFSEHVSIDNSSLTSNPSLCLCLFNQTLKAIKVFEFLNILKLKSNRKILKKEGGKAVYGQWRQAALVIWRFMPS